MRASWGPGGPLFHELENKRASKTLTGLFFTSIEMRERVGVRVDLFFMSSEIRKRIKTLTGLFSRDSFFLTSTCYNCNRKSKGG